MMLNAHISYIFVIKVLKAYFVKAPALVHFIYKKINYYNFSGTEFNELSKFCCLGNSLKYMIIQWCATLLRYLTTGNDWSNNTWWLISCRRLVSRLIIISAQNIALYLTSDSVLIRIKCDLQICSELHVF